MIATSIWIRKHGGPTVLELHDSPAPRPGPGQILVAVEAAGVAYADVLMRRGIYPETPRLPFTPGYDVVGRVAAVGPGVHQVQLGARVAALTVVGGYGTHALAPVALTVPVAETLPSTAVAALTLNYVTAHQLLHRVARVGSGEVVLVLGAAGGVGTALLELAALAGVRAIGTASGRRTEAVTSRGATPIDRARQDVAQEVLRIEPAGVAATFDPVGGPNLHACRRLTHRRGAVVSYGLSFAVDQERGRYSALGRHGLALARAKLSPGPRTSVYVIAGRRGHASRHPDQFRADLGVLLEMLAAGQLRPEVTSLPLSAAAQAHELLEAGKVTGKLVLTTGGDPSAVIRSSERQAGAGSF